MFTEPFDLTLNVDQGCVAYYTLDGSDPDPSRVGAVPIVEADDTFGNPYSYTETSYLYSGPIQVYDRSVEPNGISMIPTSNLPAYWDAQSPPAWFGCDWQAPTGLITKATVVRVRLYRDGVARGPIETRTWVNVPTQIADLPVISISTDASNLFDYDTGVFVPGKGYAESLPMDAFGGTYGNYAYSGPYFERPIHMEFIPVGGEAGFSVDMGMRMGGQARAQPFHAMDFQLRSEYGTSWLKYDLLASGTDRFKRFKLRGGGSVWFSSYINDEIGQSLFSVAGLDVQNWRPVAVYVNGEFWGVLNLRDVYDQRYLQTKYGFADGIESKLDFFNNTKYSLGDGVQYDAFMELLKIASADGTHAISDMDFAKAESMADLDNLARYQAGITMIGSQIYPNDHNDKRWRTRSVVPGIATGDGRWRWMVIDCDGAFVYAFGSVWDNPYGPLRYFVKTPAFTRKYLLAIESYANTVLDKSIVEKYLSENIARVRPWISVIESRWGNPTVASYDASWSVYLERAINAAVDARTDCASRFAVASVPVVFERTGLGVVNVDWVPVGATMKVVGEIAFPWKGEYFTTVPVPIKAEPSAGYKFTRWEADGDIAIADKTAISTTFTPGPLGGTVRAVFSVTGGNQ